MWLRVYACVSVRFVRQRFICNVVCGGVLLILLFCVVFNVCASKGKGKGKGDEDGQFWIRESRVWGSD